MSYLRSVSDPFSKGKYNYHWSKSFSKDDFLKDLKNPTSHNALRSSASGDVLMTPVSFGSASPPPGSLLRYKGSSALPGG